MPFHEERLEMSAESTPTAGTEHERLAKLEDRLDDALDRIDELEETVEQKEERIADLEAELESRAAVRWDEPSPREIVLERPGSPQSVYLGEKVFDNTDLIEEIEDDVKQLKVQGVDAQDLVGMTGDDEPELPIEDIVSQLRSDMREDPSSNKARATVVFQAFGGRATSTNGGKLVLKSPAVRNILEDPEKGDMEEVNNNTLKRTIQQTAKLTSPHTKPEDRKARSPENLITVEKRDGNLALVADSDEWHDYLSEVEERYQN